MEGKKVEQLDSEIISLREKLLEWFDKETPKDFLLIKIKNWVFALSINKKNINSFIDNTWTVILNIWSIWKFDKFESYCKKLWLKEEKDEQWVYYMYRIDSQWKKKEVDKYSEEYFNIWVDLSFMHWRDFVLKVFEWNTKKTTLKIEDKLLEMMINDKSIKFIDLLLLKQYWNISKEQLMNHYKQLQWLLLEQIWDTRFAKYPDRIININRKWKQYKIHTSYIWEEEIQYYYDSKLIWENMYKLAMEKLAELKILEDRKQKEIEKQLWEDQEAIKAL